MTKDSAMIVKHKVYLAPSEFACVNACDCPACDYVSEAGGVEAIDYRYNAEDAARSVIRRVLDRMYCDLVEQDESGDVTDRYEFTNVPRGFVKKERWYSYKVIDEYIDADKRCDMGFEYDCVLEVTLDASQAPDKLKERLMNPEYDRRVKGVQVNAL